jgi:hypothetical protein
MAKLIVDGALALGAYNLTPNTMALSVDMSTDEVPGTTFADSFENFLPGGLKKAALGVSGFTEYSSPDVGIAAALGAGNTVITAAAGRSDGSRAWFLNAMVGKYTPFSGSVGEGAKFELGAATSDRLIAGYLQAYGSKTTTGNSTGQQLGALSASQSLYASLHVITATGTTLDVTVESDDNSGFTSATTRITFTQVTTTPVAYLSSVAGAVTDTYWRMKWTISGGGPYYIVGAIGIL